MLWRSCNFGSAGSAPPHAPTDQRWDGCWRGPTHRPSSGPGWSWLVSLPAFPRCHYQVSLPSFLRLAHAVQPAARGGARSPAPRHCSPTLTPPGWVLSFAHERSRAHSPDCWVGGMPEQWVRSYLLSCPQAVLLCPCYQG